MSAKHECMPRKNAFFMHCEEAHWPALMSSGFATLQADRARSHLSAIYFCTLRRGGVTRANFPVIVFGTLSQIKINAAASSAARIRLVFRSALLSQLLPQAQGGGANDY